MYKDSVLEFVYELMVNDFRFSVGIENFDHSHTFVKDGYHMTLDISGVTDLKDGIIVPMVSFNYYSLNMPQPSVFTITHEILYSNNGKGYEGHFTLNEDDSIDKLKVHGYLDNEIQIIKHIRFSINMFISNQK